MQQPPRRDATMDKQINPSIVGCCSSRQRRCWGCAGLEAVVTAPGPNGVLAVFWQTRHDPSHTGDDDKATGARRWKKEDLSRRQRLTGGHDGDGCRGTRYSYSYVVFCAAAVAGTLRRPVACALCPARQRTPVTRQMRRCRPSDRVPVPLLLGDDGKALCVSGRRTGDPLLIWSVPPGVGIGSANLNGFLLLLRRGQTWNATRLRGCSARPFCAVSPGPARARALFASAAQRRHSPQRFAPRAATGET